MTPDHPLESEPSFADLLEAFEKGRAGRKRAEDEPRRGIVAAISGDRIFVDIGSKSEGVIPVAEMKEPVKPGDELLITIVGRDSEGYLLLSATIAQRPRDWSALQRAFDNKEIIAGRVTEAVKGGLRVDVGAQAFLPASRSGCREQADLEALIGQEIRCRILQLDVDDENIILDRRVVLEEEALVVREQRLQALQPGSVMRGTVRSLTDFGAFVDLGGIDGLLHASDMSWSRVADPKKFLQMGEQVDVKILSVERGGGKTRVALGIKQLTPDPWTTITDRLAVGDRVRGPVTKLMDFGAFVELEPGIEGLIHISEMSWARRVHHPKDVVKVGDVVETVVLGISLKERRVALGLKQALGDPWDDAAERFGAGKVVEGTVRSMQKFGAFLELAEGIEGLLHISDITAERRLNHPNEVLKQDQKVRVIVTEFDREKKRVKVSMKQLEPDETDDYIREHQVGDQVTGRVARIESGQARVELGEGVIGVYRLTGVAEAAPSGSLAAQLAAVWKREAPVAAASGGGEVLQPGQVRSFRITAIDGGTKRIELGLS